MPAGLAEPLRLTLSGRNTRPVDTPGCPRKGSKCDGRCVRIVESMRNSPAGNTTERKENVWFAPMVSASDHSARRASQSAAGDAGPSGGRQVTRSLKQMLMEEFVANCADRSIQAALLPLPDMSELPCAATVTGECLSDA